MMRRYRIALLLIPLFLWNCGRAPETPGHNDEVQGNKLPATAVATPTAAANPATEAQTPLTLVAANVNAKSGQELCVDITTASFVNLLSMQYSMRWDPEVISFKGVQGFRLPGLGPGNFGAHRTAEGLLTFVWIDETLQGITVADGTAIFQVCFQAKGKAGSSSYFRFSNGPTPFEVVNLQEKIIPLVGVEGMVNIQ